MTLSPLLTMFAGYYWAWPWAVLLLLLVPVYLYWYARRYRKQRLEVQLSYDPAELGGPTAEGGTAIRHVPLVCQLLAYTLMVLALARPQTSADYTDRSAQGIDIMLALDVSRSMLAQDFLPNRLEVAKDVATAFVNGRKNDRIGIVIFAADAFAFAPLTLDYAFLRTMIKQIVPDIMPNAGTAIGTALATGINRLRESPSPSQVVILVTDGANNAGEIDPLAAAKLAATYNVRVYTIGVGRPPLNAEAGNISTDIDEETLTQMAQLTGGRFFRATDEQGLAAIFAEISKLETAPLEAPVIKNNRDHYPVLLIAALILWLAALGFMALGWHNPLEG